MAIPLYDIGEAVYLRESAAVGALEAVVISGMSYSTQGWQYTVTTGPNLLQAQSRISSVVNGALLYFKESELVDKNTAVHLCKLNAQAAVDRFTAME